MSCNAKEGTADCVMRPGVTAALIKMIMHKEPQAYEV